MNKAELQIDKWRIHNTENDDYSSDDESDDYVENDIAPADIDNDFRNNILNVKHIIYENTVLKPTLGSSDVQDNKLIDEYLKSINKVYILSLNAQEGVINEKLLNDFPENIKVELGKILSFIVNFFKQNTPCDTIPYENYINKSFKEYQFVQNNSFE
jgi:hypothetical protein